MLTRGQNMQYRKTPNCHYSGRKRFYYKKKIFQTLVERGPLTKPQIKQALQVPSKEAKTCDRAFKELKDLKVVTKDESTGIWYAHGHEPPKTVEMHVGSPKLGLTVQVKREQAKKIIEKTPELKRDKEASTVLKEIGLLEKAQ
jgi:hypothetical protein